MECGHSFCYDCADPDDDYIQCFKCKANRRRYVEKLGIVTEEDIPCCIVCEDKIKAN